ncbi:putative bifunctional diguanylate cyclase/phosphodiesterase [Rhizobium herbae]|uniref:Diguanylate cyclase (GGDEF)-like protein/PAS domain S-box-containing protein n=1 Tax=Rhizobium herbae TaxID=508661 RepID=A0ABS4EHK8_9HYPH|nr:EAL domain-containing protein [Rhizobium herbae]MBP1857423.1 diguanylate cyclase (GGDEF)-like protein/PAS domain S-box-containing protein [Rhizobium herbae]
MHKDAVVGDEDCGIERGRLEALAGLWIAGTAPEPRFDAITQLAAHLFETPMAFITLVEKDIQRFKAAHGVDISDTARSMSVCTHTIEGADVLVVPDMREDPRFANNPLVVAAPFVRFYAGAPLTTEDGFRIGALCIADTVPRQFDERQQRTLKLLASQAMEQMRLRQKEIVRSTAMNFSDATGLALFSINAAGLIEFVNRAALCLFGYSHDEMIGRPIDIIIPDRFRGAHHAGLARVLAGGSTKLIGKTVEVVARKKDQTEVPIEISLSIWNDERGVGMGAIIRDISDRRDRDARLLRMANQDTLTGLSNRHRFENLLQEVLSANRAATVAVLDLDGFKDVNDSLGHTVGDALLQAVAVRLPSVLAADVTVARFGGDEFAILLPEAGTLDEALISVGAALSAFEAPFDVGGHVFQVAATIGFALAPEHGADAEELLASADFALYRAKQAGGSAMLMFDPEMRNDSLARRAIQDELLRALQNGELVLHYQPQVSLADGHVFGMEALIRWQHPQHGMVFPGAFLPALESSSLALPVGWWVLNEACRQAAEWLAEGLPPIKVSVNLFAAQYRASTLVQHVVDSLEKHGLAPSTLGLEVTETIALLDDDHAFAAVRTLRDLGVGIAFDDFGTGYASLSSLQRFPLTTLKIDRSFISDMLDNPHDAAITRAMLTMGNELGLETIAEGIETEEQEIALRLLGCKAGQGYRYGKALPAEQAAALLATAADDQRAKRSA